jgi:hypothetical protein
VTALRWFDRRQTDLERERTQKALHCYLGWVVSGIDGTRQVGAFHADPFAAQLFGVTDIDPMT